jgi:hypothetical protein
LGSPIFGFIGFQFVIKKHQKWNRQNRTHRPVNSNQSDGKPATAGPATEAICQTGTTQVAALGSFFGTNSAKKKK